MSDLLNQLVRLAHEKPELRTHLLPVIASQYVVIRPEGWEAGDIPKSWTRSGFVYRGMTEREFKATVGKRKPIQSLGHWSLDGEGTNFADSAEDAESYANYGSTDPRATGVPTYLVEVSMVPGMKRWSDGYIKTPNPVPFSEVSRIWKMYSTEGPTGETTLRGLSGQVVAELLYG